MPATFLSYLLAVLAAGVNAASSVLQRKANREGSDQSLHLGLIKELLHKPAWFAGIGAVTIGFLLQVVALANGPLAAVQPLLALELPITLVLGARVFRSRLRWRDWLAAAGMTAGLILMIATLAPGVPRHPHVSAFIWFVGLGTTYGLMALLTLVGARSQGNRRAAFLGVATGVGFGVTAALMTGMTTGPSGFVAVAERWQTWAMIASGAVSMFLLQSAFQAGRLVAAQPGVTLADPVVAIGWGVIAFGEPVRTGWWLLATALGGMAMFGFAVLLAHSPLVHHVNAPRQPRATERSRSGEGERGLPAAKR